MPLYKIVYNLNARPLKLNLNNIQFFQYAILNRKHSSDEFNNIKDWFCYPKNKNVSTKSINLAFNSIMAMTLQYERNIFKELLEELKLNKVLGNELKYIFNKDINQFKHFGIELDRGKITENVIKSLGNFPFDPTPIYYYSKSKRHSISIKTILNLIEAQYLAYKLNIELKVIYTYFREMKNCLFHYKSMKSVKKNLDIILGAKDFRHMSVSNIIFFLNTLRPFSLKHLKKVENNLLGISWDKTPNICPSLVKHSYQSIMFRIKMLQDMGFTNAQIQFALPYLGVLVSNICQNLHYMLKEFGSYKHDELFLRLLGACYNQKRGLNGMIWKSYDTIQKAILLKEQKRLSLLKSKSLICYLQEKLGMTKNEWKILKDHPGIIVERRALEILNFLEEKGFTKEEILESITIILYPRHVVEKNLEKVTKEKEYLRKFGFENGCVSRATNLFAKGTKLKRKTLQLCIYYLEKSVYLSEDIFLELDKVNQETENQLELRAKK